MTDHVDRYVNLTANDRSVTSLHAMLADARSGILLVGITPPRQSASQSEVEQIARITLSRLESLDLDGLVLYDIDDESDRNPAERPFPYLPTMDAAEFHRKYLHAWTKPSVIYRCVGKYSPAELEGWLGSTETNRMLGVLVGASSGAKPVQTRLSHAYAIRSEVRPEFLVGGVAISERHTQTGREHLRMLSKQANGCDFFISQIVYDVDATKSLLSDYYYSCLECGTKPRTVIITLSVCGSLKTLSFLKWLGVNVPRWLENALRKAPDPLAESYDQCLANAQDLVNFCRRLGMPLGFNIESVSNRKIEIDAAMTLAANVRRLLSSG